MSASARIGSLPPPDLVSVAPESSLLYARTVMLERQFSQLAVIDGNGTLHGAISWESMGKAHVASEYPKLADAIAPATVVDHDALLLDQTTDDVDPAQWEAVEGLLEMLRAADPRQ